MDLFFTKCALLTQQQDNIPVSDIASAELSLECIWVEEGRLLGRKMGGSVRPLLLDVWLKRSGHWL